MPVRPCLPTGTTGRRSLGRASGSGGKGKEKRVKNAARDYLLKSNALLDKLEFFINNFESGDVQDISTTIELERFIELMQKHIDLVDRRIMKGETIPHSEKLFSLSAGRRGIFEQYTEWVAKGKKRPSVELGKKVGITTDQYNLIVDYQVMENQADSQVVPLLVERTISKFTVYSWSFDKGYWNKENKKLLSENIEMVVLPKKGKCNKEEATEQSSKLFRKLRHKHSAVESNINELENSGLDRYPDRGYDHFKRYVSLAVSAYNLRRIGAELIARERKRKEACLSRKAA